MRSFAARSPRGQVVESTKQWSPSSARSSARLSGSKGVRAPKTAGNNLTLFSSSQICARNPYHQPLSPWTGAHRLTRYYTSSDRASQDASRTGAATSIPETLQPEDHVNESPSTPWTFQDYAFQSDVTGPAERYERLVDKPENANDFSLWLDLLRFQTRVNGHTGAWKIFRGMRARHQDLPVDGPEAEPLWRAFVSAGLHLHKTELVWEHAKDLYSRTNKRFVGLYEIFVGSCLARGADAVSKLKAHTGSTSRKEPGMWYESAYTWHTLLQDIDLPAPGSLQALIPIAMRHKGAMRTLWKIYDDCRERNLRQGNVDTLRHMENQEINQEIHSSPTSSKDQSAHAPDITFLSQYLSNSSSYRDTSYVPSLARPSLQKSNATLHGVPPKVLDIASKERNDGQRPTISDQFCARAFATKAFNPSFVINALQTFGVQSIGPLAVQSLVLRCRDLVDTYGTEDSDKLDALAKEANVQFKNLKGAGVKIRECKYSLLIQKLASNRDGKLLDATISSDQHPDVYEDTELQRKLFHSYMSAGDMIQALKTLTTLTFTDSNPARSAWNLVLQSRMRSAAAGSQEDWQKMSHAFETMLTSKIPISRSTIRESVSVLLEPRNPSKAPSAVKSPVDRLSFLANMWTRILEDTTHSIAPEDWKEVHKRFGMGGRLDELERLIFLLAHHYSSMDTLKSLASPSGQDQTSVRALPSKINSGRTLIDRLFPDIRQKAIIEWYFKSLADPPSAAPANATAKQNDSRTSISHIEKWARGVALLQKLKGFGLSVDTRVVRFACRQRLTHLFGDRIQTNLQNRFAKERNPHSLRHMVAYLQQLWEPEGSLFAVPEHVLRNDSEESHRYLLNMILVQPAEISKFYNDQDFRLMSKGRFIPRRHSVLPTQPPLEDRVRGLRISMHYKNQATSAEDKQAREQLRVLSSFNSRHARHLGHSESQRRP